MAESIIFIQLLRSCHRPRPVQLPWRSFGSQRRANERNQQI